MIANMDDFSPVIFGISGTVLSADEREFFAKIRPYGYILFARNCENPAQIKELTLSLQEISGQGRGLPASPRGTDGEAAGAPFPPTRRSTLSPAD